MLAEVGFFLAVLVALYLYITTIPVARRAKRLRTLVRTEQTRSVWAEARAEMWDLARDGKLDVRSDTFRVFHRIQTFVMRRPDAYDDISRLLVGVMGTPSNESAAVSYNWQAEQSTWPKDMDSVMQKMGKGTLMLAARGPGLRRFAVLFFRKILPWMAVHFGTRAARRIWRLFLRVPDVRASRDLVRTAERIEKLTHAHI